MNFQMRVYVFSVTIGTFLGGQTVLRSADCNGNGVEDNIDLRPQPGFLAEPSYAVKGQPTSMIVADLNGDGKPDLATGSSGFVSVLINKGDETFKDAVSYTVGLGRVRVLAADLDGDGKPDLATTNESNGDVSILLNQGDGTFKDAVTYDAIVTCADVNCTPLIAADLNGDGHPDLVTAGGTVLLNNGDGTFKDNNDVWLALGGPALGAALVADFNGDGSPDLAMAGYPGSNYDDDLYVLLNQGDGTFRGAVRYAVGGDSGFSLIAADFNGDGKPDLVTSGGSVLVNNGDGTFKDAVGVPGFPRVAADLNGDGTPDLATVDDSGLSIFLNRGDATFQDIASYPVVTQIFPLPSLIAADLNGDGKPDLATVNAFSNAVSVLLNQGDGTFTAAVNYAVGAEPSSLIAADLNGDGEPDLATANHSSGDVSVLINLGEGTFKGVVPFTGEVHLTTGFLLTADFNGDGKPDLATAGYGFASVLINQGDGTFKDAVIYPLGDRYPGFFITDDLNGDNNLDLILTHPQHVCCLGESVFGLKGFSIFVNQGDGTFDVMSYHQSNYLVAADFNGDGKPDLAGLGPSDVFILFNETTAPFSLDRNHNGIPDECDPGRFHRGDPNVSGTTDISDGIAIFGFLFLGNPATLSCKESADVNNDGKIDISDGISLLNWLFIGGPAPAPPGPTDVPCGIDPDPAGSPRDLGCEAYDHCN